MDGLFGLLFVAGIVYIALGVTIGWDPRGWFNNLR